MKDNHILDAAAELAYFFLMSLFPFLILLNILIKALNLPPDIIEKLISPLLPDNVASLIIYYNSHITKSAVAASVSIGIFFLIYSSSKAIRILNKTFLLAYGFQKRLSYFRSLLMAASATLCLLVISALSLLLISLFSVSANFIKSLLALFLLAVSVMVLNLIHYLATFRKLKFKHFLPGSTLSVISVCIASYGFAVYFNNFSNFSAIYGTLSAVMLLVLWLYVFSVVLISGAHINAELIKPYTKSG